MFLKVFNICDETAEKKWCNRNKIIYTFWNNIKIKGKLNHWIDVSNFYLFISCLSPCIEYSIDIKSLGNFNNI